MITKLILKEDLLNKALVVDNEYLDKYIDLIINNLKTQRIKCQTQRHHIVPKYYFRFIKSKIDNSKDNIVNLYYKDHILAHYYLARCSYSSLFAFSNWAAINIIADKYDVRSIEELDFDYVQKCYSELMTNNKEYNAMYKEDIKTKHDNIMRSEDVRRRISETLKKKRREEGFSKEHLDKIALSRKRRAEERKKQGLKYYEDTSHCATRCVGCYCIVNEEEYHFKSYLEAGLWWFNTLKPFGDNYSEATFRRKIIDSINDKDIIYNNKEKNELYTINNIKWYKEGDDIVG